MTSTKLLDRLLIVVAAFALVHGGTGTGRGQVRRAEEQGELRIRHGEKDFWHVEHSDACFIARRYHPDDHPAHPRNFQEGIDWMKVGGQLMGYDLVGKSKDVVPVRRDSEATRWLKEGAGGRLRMRVRVRNGKLKGWWVGLKVLRDKPEPREPAKAKLVLVKDKKDAAVFNWDDPDDISP